jgi:hypothetical protein
MKMKIEADRLTFLIILILFSLLTMFDSLSFPGFSGLLPFCTGLAISTLALILVGIRISPRFSRVFEAYFGLRVQSSGLSDSKEQGQDEILPWRRVFTCWGWMLGFFLLILLVGYSIATPLFTFALLWLFCRRKWLSSVAATLIICGFVYFISTVFNMELLEGVIFGGILPLL